MKDIFLQALFRFGMPALAISAIFYNNEWADNFFTFLTIFLAIAAIWILTIDETEEKIRAGRQGKNLPAFTRFITFTANILLCIYAGWFWLSITWIGIWLCIEGKRIERDKILSESI